MAMRHYLGAAAESTPIAFAPSAEWEDTSILQRAYAQTAKRSLNMTTVYFADVDRSNRDILFRQYDLGELESGQRIISDIAGILHVSICIRVMEEGALSNMGLRLGLRIMAADGTTVRATLVPVTGVSTEASPTELASRYGVVNMADVDYTTVVGDHAVLEIGTGGDPT